jgi:hypothetical protein
MLMGDGELIYALPVWIMTTEQVSMLLPSKFGLFDLVILEEASQSDCLAIPTLLRGKKLVIIGDDKQCNPPEGKNLEYEEMIERNLGDSIPGHTVTNLLPGKSVFDLFDTIFGGSESRVLMREHFRCVPEIINFCNTLCYDNRLIPLKQSKPGFGLPIQTKFVEDGSAVGTDSGKPVNEKEAQEIVRHVRNFHIFFLHFFSCVHLLFFGL